MYISVQDLTLAFSQTTLIALSNDMPRATEVNTTTLDRAIEYAQETVDGYLRSRYSLPLETVPTIVRNICLQLARYWLYARRPEGKNFPDTVTKTYERAIKELEAIQTGKLHLGISELNAKQTDDLVTDTARFRSRAKPKMDLSGY